MNYAALLSLLADLYAQVAALQQRNAELEKQLADTAPPTNKVA